MPEISRNRRIMSVVFATLFVIFGVTAYRPWGAIGQAATYWFQPFQGRVARVARDNDGGLIEIEYSYEHGGRRYFNDQLSRCRTTQNRNSTRTKTSRLVIHEAVGLDERESLVEA